MRQTAIDHDFGTQRELRLRFLRTDQMGNIPGTVRFFPQPNLRLFERNAVKHAQSGALSHSVFDRPPQIPADFDIRNTRYCEPLGIGYRRIFHMRVPSPVYIQFIVTDCAVDGRRQGLVHKCRRLLEHGRFHIELERSRTDCEYRGSRQKPTSHGHAPSLLSMYCLTKIIVPPVVCSSPRWLHHCSA